MLNLNKKAEEVFNTDVGATIYNQILLTMKKHGMEERIHEGVLLGFSGGADSVTLLLFLLEYQRRVAKDFTILCVHVNHNIRGEEATRDERFSRDIVTSSSAEFMLVSEDVPTIANKCGLGLEEAARNVRYSNFDRIISGREDVSCIAVAHNATDNMETVIFNMLRGAGLSGICGIKPTRDDIVRPLLSISKEEIVSLLESFGVPYVTDSTNLSSEYSRNYIRNEILPLFKRITPNPEGAISRMTENLLSDFAYIDSVAQNTVAEYYRQGYIDADALSLLPHAIFARVISSLAYKMNGLYPEEKHITAIRHLMCKSSFAFSLPGKYNFSRQRGKCVFIEKSSKNALKSLIFPLAMGENKISGTNLTVYVGDVEETLINVYSFSIKTSISSAIIDSGIFLRTKNDGDSYKYSGMTHKLKKVFNDRNIPPCEREYIPILVDAQGILWVPGLQRRDNSSDANTSKNVSVTLCYEKESDDKITMYTALNRV